MNVALPTLSRALRASTTSLQWNTDAYTLAVAGLLLTLGDLGDPDRQAPPVRGRLLAVIGLGSALAGMSGSAGQLHRVPGAHGHRRGGHHAGHAVDPYQRVHQPSRAGQGDRRLVGGGGPRCRHRPSTGGWLLEHFAWGSIFMVNLPIVAVALAVGRFVIPPSASPHRKPLDPAGALLWMSACWPWSSRSSRPRSTAG